MSRKHDHEAGLFDGFGIGGTKPTLPSLVILILIILQFSGSKFGVPGEDGLLEGFKGVDNGILFIIALFFLSSGNTFKTIF